MPMFCNTHFKTRLLAGAAMLLASLAPALARAQAAPDPANALLISILVKRGVISQGDADAIMHEVAAEQEEAKAQAAVPVPTTVTTSSVAPDGTIHVTYVPKIVRDQITQQVKNEVLAQEQAQGYAEPAEVPDWIHRVRIYGDFRFRYESDLFPKGNDDTGAFPNFNAINTGSPYDISTANNNFPASNNVNENRNRFRIRARLGVDADLGDGFELGFRLATGENDSPVSENQTLGNAPGGAQGGEFSKYAIWIDRAHLDYSPPYLDPNVAKLTFSVGRFDNPFFSTNLIFADDLGFDGIAADGLYKLDDGLTPFFTLGAFPIYDTDFNFASNQPAKYVSHDKYMFGAQVGSEWKINDDYTAKLAVADYAYTNVAGKLSTPCTVLSAADSCSTDDNRPSFAQNGNTYMALRDILATTANNNGTTNQYQYFGLASNFNELALDGEFDLANFDPTHLWVVGEYVKNLAFAKSDVAAKAVNNRGAVTATSATGDYVGGDTGYFAYFAVGQKVLQKRCDWNATLGYKYLETDAVIDGLTDSDFGLGGTNLKGFIVSGQVALDPKVWVRARYLSADSIVGPTYRADVFQLDLNAKF